MLEREKKKAKLVAKYAKQREQLKKIVKKSKDFKEIEEAQTKLAKMPHYSNPVTLTTRCEQCGRGHAVYQKFMLCRICFRQQLMTANVTGGRKSSW